MGAWLKVVMWFAILTVALGGICLLTGGIAAFSMKDDFVALQKQVAAAQEEIQTVTRVRANVNASLKERFGDGLQMVEVSVQYERIPPGADRDTMYRAAEQAVRRHVKNVAAVAVIGIQNPDPVGPGVRQREPLPPLPPPQLAAVVPADAGSQLDEGASAGRGKLTLFTIPPGATVTLKGKSLGKTPLVNAAVPAGTLLLKLTFPDGSRKKLSAKIRRNALAKFKFNQDELPAD